MRTEANGMIEWPSLGRLAWIMSVLILVTWALASLGILLISNAIDGGHMQEWQSLLIVRAFLALEMIISIELAVVLIFYRPLPRLFRLSPNGRTMNLAEKLGLGLAGSLSALALSLPFLFPYSRHDALVRRWWSNPVSIEGIVQLVLLVFVLPTLSEMVFRGIAFRSLKRASSFWPAAIGSALLFACVWPVFYPVVAIILGVISSFVFEKTRSLVASITTNGCFTLLAEAFVVIRMTHVL